MIYGNAYTDYHHSHEKQNKTVIILDLGNEIDGLMRIWMLVKIRCNKKRCLFTILVQRKPWWNNEVSKYMWKSSYIFLSLIFIWVKVKLEFDRKVDFVGEFICFAYFMTVKGYWFESREVEGGSGGGGAEIVRTTFELGQKPQ